MNKRFPFFNKYEKKDIEDGIYKIKLFQRKYVYKFKSN